MKMQDQCSSVIVTTTIIIRFKVRTVILANHNTYRVYNPLSIFKLMGIFSGIHKLTARLTSLRWLRPISNILKPLSKFLCSYLTIVIILHSTVIITIIQVVHLAIAFNRITITTTAISTTSTAVTMVMAVTAIAITTTITTITVV